MLIQYYNQIANGKESSSVVIPKNLQIRYGNFFVNKIRANTATSMLGSKYLKTIKQAFCRTFFVGP